MFFTKKSPRTPLAKEMTKIQMTNEEMHRLLILLFPWSKEAEEANEIIQKANSSVVLANHLYQDNAKKNRRTNQLNSMELSVPARNNRFEDRELLEKAFKFTAQAGTAEYLFCCLALLEIHNRLHTNSGYNFLEILPMIKFVGTIFFAADTKYDLNIGGADLKTTRQWVHERDKDYAEVNFYDLVKNTASLLSQQFNSYFPKNTDENVQATKTSKVELRAKIMENYSQMLQEFKNHNFSFPSDYELHAEELFPQSEQNQLPSPIRIAL